MRIRTLDAEVWAPLPIERVFAFFSDASNLDKLTPAWMQFQIVTPTPLELRVGTVIDYRLKVRWMPLRWSSEITVWSPPHRFVDEQRKGPYKLWVHEHSFREDNGGTLVRDHVDYAVPGWICEPLLHRYLVGPDLRAIFEYRKQKMRELLTPEAQS